MSDYRTEMMKRMKGLMPQTAPYVAKLTKAMGHPSRWTAGEDEDGQWWLQFAPESKVAPFKFGSKEQVLIMRAFLITSWVACNDDWVESAAGTGGMVN